jgi:VanZ family protein
MPDLSPASTIDESSLPDAATSSGRHGVEVRNRRSVLRVSVLLYAILIIYGSLYPLTGWSPPSAPLFSFLTDPIPAHSSQADLGTNVLAYIPLGILLGALFATRRRWPAILAATFLGGMLSFALESAQMFLPSRTSSKVDLLTNILGTLAGAVAGSFLRREDKLALQFRRARAEWFETQDGVNIGLAAGALWAMSQISPFVPSMDVSSIAQGLAPLWQSLHDPASISLLKAAVYAFNLTALGLLLSVIVRPPRKITMPFLASAFLVLCLKPFIVSRQLAGESLCGLAAAALLLLVLPRAKGLRALLAIFFLVAGFAISEMTAGPGGLHSFNWIPFAGQVDNTVSGFGSILETVWPFVALAALTILGFGTRRKPMLYVGGLLLLMVLALEWVQQGIPGRYGDITTVILAAAGWTLSWFAMLMGRESAERQASPRRRRRAVVDSV